MESRNNPISGTGFFVNNRKSLRKNFGGTAPIVITSGGLLQKSLDVGFPFHVDNNFFYLTGVSQPDLVLVMDGAKDYIIVPSRSEKEQVFDGQINIEEILVRSGVSQVYVGDDGWKRLSRKIKRVKHVALLEPSEEKLMGMYANPARADLVTRIKTINQDIALLDVRPILAKMRQIKQPYEVEAIQEAVDATSKLFRLIKRRLSSFEGESDVMAEVLHFATSNQLELSYDPVIAGGKNALTLHYTKNNSQISSKQALLLDIGLKTSGYCADITRVYCAKPTKRMKQIHQQVIEIQDYAISLLKPGVLLQDYENSILHFVGEKLRELGLISSITPEVLREYYPHSTSHFLGLDVHDVADYTKPLEPGMVLTVEPGIYVSEEGIGVRIEDNVLITENGAKVLSHKLPRELS